MSSRAGIYNSEQIQSGDLTKGMIVQLVKLWQEANGLTVDGFCGPNTQSSISSLVHADNGSVSSFSRLTRDALVVASECLGKGETGGNNSGPFVEMLHGLDYDGNTDDDGAWCAAFVGYCFLTAALNDDTPLTFTRSGGAKRLFKNISNAGECVLVSDLDGDARTTAIRDFGVLPGDVICFHRGKPGSWMGHIGIVERLDGGVVHTIEGNVGTYPSKVRRFRRGLDNPNLIGFARV